MTTQKSKSEQAAGKLISSIQKEWGKELGEETADLSEIVVSSAHSLLQARNADCMLELMGNQTIKEFLGVEWVNCHQSVIPAINELSNAIRQESEEGT
jgi:hypothetical protein